MGKRKPLFLVLVIVFLLALMWVTPSAIMATTFKADVLYSNTAKVLIQGFNDNFITAYTEYTLKTYDFQGPLDAFCVEAVAAATSTAMYELVDVDSSRYAAAVVAQRYWSGEGLITKLTKEDYQIIIWELVFDYGAISDLSQGKFQYGGGASDQLVLQKYLESLSASEKLSPNIQIAQTPVGGDGVNRQDYLVRVPVSEPATMLLLGAGLIGLAAFGRKNLLKKV